MGFFIANCRKLKEELKSFTENAVVIYPQSSLIYLKKLKSYYLAGEE
jgi:hypothetical protein